MKRKKLKVMVFGTFDILHPGHLHFLKSARSLGDFLVVSVARDSNSRRIKGFRPIFHERDRMALVKSLHDVDKVVLGGKKDYLPHVIREKPDIIALGYDQKAYARELRADIAAGKIKAKILRLKPYKTSKYKSGKYRGKIKAS